MVISNAAKPCDHEGLRETIYAEAEQSAYCRYQQLIGGI